MKKILCILLAVMLTLTIFIGCTSSEKPTEGGKDTELPQKSDTSRQEETTKDLPILRVAVIPVVSSIPVPYIMEQGWDIENGFKIETEVFSSGAPMGEALVADLWDLGIMSAAGVFAAANYDAMCIADTSDTIGERGIGIFVRPDSPIAKVKGSNPTYPTLYGDPETVKGKTIMFPKGTLSQLQVTKWLEKIGLKDLDTDQVHMEFAQAYQAFMSGQGDIVALNPPFCFNAADEGMIEVAPVEDLGVELHDMVFANKKSYEDKKEIIKKFLELLYRANEDFEKDQELKERVLRDWYKVNGVEVEDEVIKREATKAAYTIEDIRKMEVGDTLIATAEFFASIGNIETSKLPIIKDNINDELVKEILK